MSASYAYASGSVRARETGLLTAQDMQQLLVSRDAAQLTAMLRDRDYGLDGGDADSLLREESAKAWDYLREIAPDFSLFYPFLYRHDYHNVKAVLKGVLRGRPYEDILLKPCTVEISLLETAVKERKFSLLPAHMAGAAEQAYDLLAHTADTQRSDAVLDRAALRAMLEGAERTKVPLMQELMRYLVFYADVKTALRAARTHKDKAFLDLAVCGVPGTDTQGLKRAAAGGMEELTAFLEQKDCLGSRKAMEQLDQSPSAFEKWVDDGLLDIARRGKRVTMGPEPLIGYLMAKEAEIKTMHILLSGLRAGQEEESIRERLRELYG